MSDAEPTKPTARVEISAGAHSVIIEATGSLHSVAKKALELWHATDSPHLTGGFGAMGFHTELFVESTDVDDDEPPELS